MLTGAAWWNPTLWPIWGCRTRRIALIFDMQLKGGILRPGVAGVTAVIERVTSGIAKEDHEAKERQRVTVGTAHTVIAAMS